MAEYLSPGVYVEETSYRAKSIEGVATSTAGFVGQCRFGPVNGLPTLVTSLEEYNRIFGDLEDLVLQGERYVNYLGRSVRHFFENGGKRVYVSRLFVGGDPANADDGIATAQVSPDVRFRARFPGQAGNLPLSVTANQGSNANKDGKLVGLRRGDLVRVGGENGELRCVATNDVGDLFLASHDGNLVAFSNQDEVVRITLNVNVGRRPNRVDEYRDLSPVDTSSSYIGRVLRTEDPDRGIEPPYDRSARVWLNVGAGVNFVDLYGALTKNGGQFTLNGGHDGKIAAGTAYIGGGTGHEATGLQALAEIEDIAIVAAPGAAALGQVELADVHSALIAHCELLRYRFAILSPPKDASHETIRELRATMDSKYAALYFPWLVVANGGAGATVDLPPDGFVAGIYARSDIERGVHKAPANEVIRGIRGLSRVVTTGHQDVLNPLGINCLRSFEGRGHRVWGARTISSDPEWTYLNVRRLFIYLEHSIDRATQWVVFEPNNEALWLRVRLTIELFLTDVWRTGALMGTSPREAFFVRCDRSTMTQGDLDNGRLICLIGVAPTKPAEFVIFRIGQWTADASII